VNQYVFMIIIDGSVESSSIGSYVRIVRLLYDVPLDSEQLP